MKEIVRRERELFSYWRAISGARQARRVDPAADTTEQQDDLDGIAFNTHWPRLKAATALAVSSLITPLSVDLSAFDIWPHEAQEINSKEAKIAD